jgi:hypothetical protein
MGYPVTWVALWHWLEAQGFVRDVVGIPVALVSAHLAGWHPRRHLRVQEQIADRLDTSTPGGLGDVVQHLGGEKQ